MGRGPTPDAGTDFSGEATNPGYAGLSNRELGDLGVPGYTNYSGPAEPPPSLWDKLMDAAGQAGSIVPKTSMPGTTFGPQAGAGAAPIFPSGPTPPGMGSYFNAIQNPPASGSNLMAQYAALQQLMRGS